MSKQPCTYMLACRPNGTLYVGVTSDLTRRVCEHRTSPFTGSTRQYSLVKLVWYEAHESMLSAIERERALKRWNRLWKLKLVESVNPEWRDLYEELIRPDM